MMKLIDDNEIEAIRGKMPLLAGFLSKASHVSVPEGADLKAFIRKVAVGAKLHKAPAVASGLAIMGICAATPVMILDPHNNDHLLKKFVSFDFSSEPSQPNIAPADKDARALPQQAIPNKLLRDLAANARNRVSAPAAPSSEPSVAPQTRTTPSRHLHRGEVSPRLVQAINHAHSVTGVDRSVLGIFAFLESSLNQKTGTSRSSAEGAFQYTKQAWLDTVSHYGKQHSHGLALAADHIERDDSGHLTIDEKKAGRFILNLRDNLAVSATLAADAIKHNQSLLEEKFGHASATTLYTFHLLGPTAAIKFLRAEERGGIEMCSDILKSGISANREIFTRDGHDISVREAYDKIHSNVMAAREMVREVFPENVAENHLTAQPEYEAPAP